MSFKGNIIVVDDTPENLHLLNKILSKEGYAVRAAINGKLALQSLQTERPDLILLDIKMPDMTGYEVCEIIKADKANENIPIIFVSALSDSIDKVKAFSLGAVDFIIKPFQPEEVLARVKNHLTISKLQNSLKEQNKTLQQEVVERKKVENALYNLNIDLDNKIKEKTAELAYELEIQKALADVSSELLSETYDIKKITKSVLICAQKLTKSEHGFVSVIDQKTKENIVYTFTEMNQCKIEDKSIAFPPGPDGKYNALWGYTLNTLKPFYTNDPKNHPFSVGLPHGHIPLECFLSVPVIFDQRLVGQIAIANATKDYEDSHLTAINRLAELYAISLHRFFYETEKENLQNQMQHMQKIEAIGTLAGGIAHDFNNLLFIMTGNLQMALSELSDEHEAKSMLDEVLAASNRASDLVKQILTFARKDEEKKDPIKTQNILKEILKLTRSTLPSTIHISHNINPNCGNVMADPIKIHQIIMNLITNSFHAMQETGGKLSINLNETNIDSDKVQAHNIKTGKYVCLTISDSGIGMPPKVIERIFDPYFTTKEKGKGTGLGLAVVHGIVKSYEGIIDVKSESGKGTTFKIYLPKIETKKNIEKQDNENQIKGENEHILVVEDEPVSLQMIGKMLSMKGFRVTLTENGGKALEKFTKNPNQFDLVLTDMAMPELTGAQLAKKILSIRQDIPIIICTGFSDQIDKQSAKSIGIKDFLMKPITQRDLVKAIKKQLS